MKLQDLNLEDLLKKSDIVEIVDFDSKIRYYTDFNIHNNKCLVFWRDGHYYFSIMLDEEIILANENTQIQTVDEENMKVYITFNKFRPIDLNCPAEVNNEGFSSLVIAP